MFNRLFKSEHQHIKEMLSAYLDGELSPKEQARVEKHLARCTDCAQNLHTLRQTVTLLEQLPPVAIPRSFAIRPAPAARRPSFFQTRRAYVYLRAATALATILLAVVLAGDVFLTGLAPYLTPARGVAAPVAKVVREVKVEKPVVEKGVPVEKPVVETVVIEKPVEVTKVVEKVLTATPALPEKEDELALTRKPLPTPVTMGKGIEVAPALPSTPEREVLAEERAKVTAISTTLPAEVVITAKPALTPTAMPTAIAEVLPPTPIPQEPAAPAVSRPSRLMLLRAVEVGLLVLVFVLAIATLAARRRQSAA